MASPSVQQRIGTRIRTLRNDLRLTQHELAERAGTSATYLGQVERGTRDAGIGVLDRIAHALGIPLSALVGRQPDSLPETLASLTPSARRIVLGLARDLARHEAGALPVAADG